VLVGFRWILNLTSRKIVFTTNGPNSFVNVPCIGYYEEANRNAVQYLQ
jgi:hypothetical protein